MHMVSKRDLNSAQLETMRFSKNPTTVMTANGEVQTREEATVYVKELDSFVIVMLEEETPVVLSLGKLCEDSWVYRPLDQWSKTTCHPKWQKYHLQKKSELRTIRCPWPVDEFLRNPSRGSAETESTNKNGDDEELRSAQQKEVKFMSEESRGNPSRGSAKNRKLK